MAQRVQVQLVDDLTGEQAQETVRFSLDGTQYEIDLTQQNADSLRAALADYVDKGRRAGSGRQPAPSPKAGSSRSKREDTQEIRQWAQENGYNPSSRGRITQSIIDAFNESR
ncbi:Lsr2 family protein [Arthrobacter sp. NamB2]|uniref:histone-like nucleoid-structuring protein Lsr2 n=1 Tax=Arthrobacter sp. NamB2 TaxID=2576035 RepID=UPI0010C9FA35|nr:Lsr2 family protein [Arthrobacter sp. NamB2]TKV29058.1 Lsr2 family protein [Arthrobacter sp. NamB2]